MDEVIHIHTNTHELYTFLDPVRTNKVLTKAEATEWKEK